VGCPSPAPDLLGPRNLRGGGSSAIDGTRPLAANVTAGESRRSVPCDREWPRAVGLIPHRVRVLRGRLAKRICPFGRRVCRRYGGNAPGSCHSTVALYPDDAGVPDEQLADGQRHPAVDALESGQHRGAFGATGCRVGLDGVHAGQRRGEVISAPPQQCQLDSLALVGAGASRAAASRPKRKRVRLASGCVG
jgi:hypothetical protein